MKKIKTFRDTLKELKITDEEKALIKIEEDIIDTMIAIREKKKITQTELAKVCNMKQSVLSRIESSKHSPQLDTLIRALVPLGYTLKICPIKA